MFGRATIRLGIGPHSSLGFLFSFSLICYRFYIPVNKDCQIVICVRSSLCIIVAHNTAQKRPDNFPSCPPDNHHCSDDVYLRDRGSFKRSDSYTLLRLSVDAWTIYHTGLHGRCIIIDSDSRPCKHASFNVSTASQVRTVTFRDESDALVQL